MPTFVPISRERHGTKRWKRYPDYRFAASNTVVPLQISEFPKATPVLPVAFVTEGDGFVPAAVLGTVPGQNLFIDSRGRWSGPYIPAAIRAYPFALAPMADGREVLCVDEDSGLITDDDGEAIIDPNGAPSRGIADALAFLEQISIHRKRTQSLCNVLKDHGLIRPWPFAIATPSGEQKIEGLYCIDEEALNALPSDAFLKVREAGCLPAAYLQLLAMQHMPVLWQLIASKASVPTVPVNADGELDLEFLNEGLQLDSVNLK